MKTSPRTSFKLKHMCKNLHRIKKTLVFFCHKKSISPSSPPYYAHANTGSPISQRNRGGRGILSARTNPPSLLLLLLPPPTTAIAPSCVLQLRTYSSFSSERETPVSRPPTPIYSRFPSYRLAFKCAFGCYDSKECGKSQVFRRLKKRKKIQCVTCWFFFFFYLPFLLECFVVCTNFVFSVDD